MTQTAPPKPAAAAPPPAPAAPPAPKGPQTFTHPTQPTWGVGLVVQEVGKHWVIFFEGAGEKKFVKELAQKALAPVTLEAAKLAALQTRASGRKPRAAPKSSIEAAKAKRAAKPKAAAAPRFATLKEQIALFEKLFTGGFAGEAFIKEERGAPGVTGKKGLKEAAIALTKSTLGKAAFDASVDDAFAAAKAVLAATNIAHPLEGTVPFSALSGDDRAKAIAGLKQLLHGDGAYAERVERFVASLNLKDGDKAKKVTWPMATLFGALMNPNEHVCVKPTAFAAQAQTLGLTVDKSQAVNAEGYAKFLEVAKKTQAALVEAGHQPRDLIDVYSFIYRTHAEKLPAA